MRNERQGDMTQGNPLPLMVKFAIPMLIGGIFQLLYNMVDTVVLGRYVGVSALASIGVTGTTVFGIVQGGCAVMNAISVVAAQCFGSGDDDRLKLVVGNSIWLVLITGAVLGAVGFWGARPIMQLIGTPDDIIDGAVLYLQITCGLVIIQLLYNAVAALLRAIGDSRTPLIFLIVCSLLNVALDLIFVINFKMEIAGVAIATIISQAVSAVLAIAYMLKKYAVLRFTAKHMRIDRGILASVMRIGAPMAAQTLLITVGMMVTTSVINSFGSGTVAAYTVGNKVEQLATVLFSQVAFSFSVFAGQNFGARKYDRIKDGMRKMLLLVVGLSVISTVVMFMFGRQIAWFFVEADTPASVIDSAYNMIRIEAALYSALGGIWVYNSALRGIGDAQFTLLSATIELVAKVVLSVVLSKLFGEIGIWFASPLGWIPGMLPSAIRFHRGKWERRARASDAAAQT